MRPRWRWWLWRAGLDLSWATGWRWPFSLTSRLAPVEWFVDPSDLKDFPKREDRP